MANRIRATGAVLTGLLIACAAMATPAAANLDQIASPDNKHINGIRLGDTRADVHDSTPFGKRRPTITTTRRFAGRRLLTEIWIDGDVALAVYYVKRKGRPARVAAVQGGSYYVLSGSSLHTAPGNNGSTVSQIASAYEGCVFFLNGPAGREYNPDPGDGQTCELQLPGGAFFYFSFNHNAAPGGEATLTAVSLSRFRLP